MNRRTAIASAASGLVATALPRIVRAAAGAPQAAPAALVAPGTGPILVAFVVGDRANVMDIAGPWETFQDVMILDRGDRDADTMPFQLAMVSDNKAPFAATGGMSITPHYTYEDIPQPKVIVVGAQGEHTPAKLEWIREASKKADVVMSVCTGAFVLGDAGVLDGTRATTHHAYYDSFAKKFPNVDLVRGPRYVENATFSTSGGLTSGIELALRVVERYFGNDTVASTAYYLEYVRSPKRPEATGLS